MKTIINDISMKRELQKCSNFFNCMFQKKAYIPLENTIEENLRKLGPRNRIGI
jgi:hypothetical protein